MYTFDRKKITFFVVVLLGAIGLTIDGLKSISWYKPTSKVAQLDLDMSPYISSPLKSNQTLQRRRTQIRLTKNNQHPPSSALAKKEDQKISEKEKKKDKKKKKKVAKKKRDNELNAKNEILNPAQSNNNKGLTADNSPFGPSSKNPPIKESEKESDSEIEDKWRTALLLKPNPEETNNFIEEYLSGRIPHNIFYKIVNEMLADSQLEMKNLGVMALGATPSKDSFVLLVSFSEKNQLTSWLKSETERYFHTYTRFYRVSLLTSILNDQNYEPSVTIKASLLLQSSAQRNLVPHSQGKQDQNIEKPYSEAATILQRISMDPENKQVGEAASQAYETINQLLNS